MAVAFSSIWSAFSGPCVRCTHWRALFTALRPFLGRLPLSLAIREASDAGTPPASSTGPEADAFAALASKLLETLETPVH